MTVRKVQTSGVEYAGKRSKTGNSLGFRFEGALFKSHPEFNGEVRARVIAPGRMLVVAEDAKERDADPVLASFLAFLQEDMRKHPGAIRSLSLEMMQEIGCLVEHVAVPGDEDLGDEELL